MTPSELEERKKLMAHCDASPDGRHSWVWEEEYDNKGEMVAWDNCCEHCWVWRDWSVDIPEEEEHEDR